MFKEGVHHLLSILSIVFNLQACGFYSSESVARIRQCLESAEFENTSKT